MDRATGRPEVRAGLAGTCTVWFRVWFRLAVIVGGLATAACTTLPPRHTLPAEALGEPAFQRTAQAYAGTPIVAGNRLTILLNGDQLFPALLAAIHEARRTITYAQYYWDRGAVGRALAEAIATRCRAGVGVHVLVDGFGALGMPAEHRAILEQAGCHLARFHPLHDLAHLDHRNHQRILVVDGTVGFTGGWGVGRRWTGDGREPGHWRQTDVRVEGPVVAWLQSCFVRTWADATGVVLGGADYFPALAPRGQVAMQVVASDPEDGQTGVYTSLLLAIAAARHTIMITTPYFVPDDTLLDALLAASARGTRVQLLLAGPIDWNVVRAAGRHDYGRLLKAGIEIFEYRAGLLHAKTVVIDGQWASVGSANLDVRSLGINRELNVVAYDAGVARALEAIFRSDCRTAHRLDLPSWQARSIWRRLFEWLALPARDLL
jgi:cardiolipin synthase